MKKILNGIVVFILMVALIISVSIIDRKININEISVPLTSNNLIQQNDYDINVIPDKYNTGAIEPNGGFTNIPEDSLTLNDVLFLEYNNGYKLDLFYRNKTIEGAVIFENVDFKTNFTDYNSCKIEDRNIKLVFNNCKFDDILTPPGESKVEYEFNNCTIKHFAGSNATFNRCRIGDSYKDGLNPYHDVTVNDCYFVNLSTAINSDTEYHTDGTQIFGRTNVIAENIKYNNCRFEMPQLAYENSRINACFMLQLEFSDGKNISFDNCKLNGGGFAIYCRALKGFTFSDVNISNVKIGAANRFGFFYNDISEGANIDYNSVVATQNLYVGTVYKNDEKIYLSVTNDTNQDRILRVFTSSGEKYDYNIKACPTYEQIGNMEFEEFPFDQLIEVPENSDWVVCCDATSGSEEQIRYVNWTNDDVYLSLAKKEELEIEADTDSTMNNASEPSDSNIVDSGVCGKDVTYKLYNNGELCLVGEGDTKNYSSSTNAPWYDYREDVTSIVIDEEIDSIGNQLFRNCNNLNEVEIPEGVTSIGANSFMGCNSLEKITLPVSLKSIGKYAFWNTNLAEIIYNGTDEQFSAIEIYSCNPSYLTEYEVPKATLVDSGSCGNDVAWELYSDGKMILSGTGKTIDYNSVNIAPWNNKYEDVIISVEVGEDITSLGNQLFRKCINLKDVKLPTTLEKIGTNTFINCESLVEITLPNSLTSIGNAAFKASGLKVINYSGSSEEWDKILIGTNALPVGAIINY